jgi:hypothetical protein
MPTVLVCIPRLVKQQTGVRGSVCTYVIEEDTDRTGLAWFGGQTYQVTQYHF